jgi:hypothetical protein
LTQIEEAFRNLKGDLAVRPIYHSSHISECTACV